MSMALATHIRQLAGLSTPTKEALCRLEAEWSPDAPPDTVAASVIARAFVAGLDLLSNEEMASIGSAAEAILASGDEGAKSAVTTGFLEALLGQASSGRLDFLRVARILGPESLQYCRAWDKFTGVTTPGLEI
jgi:hypothetical protein